MSLDRAAILHVARLARLELAEAEIEKMGRQLDSILGYVESLGALPTSDVPPTTHVESEGTPLRDDESRPSFPREEALRGAPGSDGTFFKVPRVVQR